MRCARDLDEAEAESARQEAQKSLNEQQSDLDYTRAAAELAEAVERSKRSRLAEVAAAQKQRQAEERAAEARVRAIERRAAEAEAKAKAE